MADLGSSIPAVAGIEVQTAALMMSDRAALQTRRPEPVQKRLVTFVCDSPSAESVAIAGTFTNWRSLRMYRDTTGVWGIAQRLAPGEYEYRVMIDGVWGTDPANPNKTVNRYGVENSVFIVPE